MKNFSIYKRILISIAVSTIFVVLIWLTSQFKEPPEINFLTFVWFLIAHVTFEVICFFQKKMRNSKILQKNLIQQILFLLSSIAIGTLAYSLLFFGFKWMDHLLYYSEKPNSKHMTLAFIIGLCLSIIFSLIQYLSDLKNQHFYTLIENEKIKSEITEANLLILKNQLNPHFLFNNFNTLYFLIDEDTESAKSFLKNISSIYRVMLQNKNNSVIDAKEEYGLAIQYLDIMKQRYQNALIINNNLFLKEIAGKKLPPLVLQQLIENAIKHNQIDKDTPLELQFNNDNDSLSITSIGIKKVSGDHLGSGLQNIQKRYSYLTNEKVKIVSKEKIFKVTIPFI
ncbi:histidine kinase [uncultured Aquimarina sp.]|uniref:sensor histidine kinase n=1 Tax=uncultured Aquimarina sp. TaxID=575652 RepID=UPI002602AE91|nr:histidine kinase [uncultured Aquimarina sp.]